MRSYWLPFFLSLLDLPFFCFPPRYYSSINDTFAIFYMGKTKDRRRLALKTPTLLSSLEISFFSPNYNFPWTCETAHVITLGRNYIGRLGLLHNVLYNVSIDSQIYTN